jgi:hypothetical protein
MYYWSKMYNSQVSPGVTYDKFIDSDSTVGMEIIAKKINKAFINRKDVELY